MTDITGRDWDEGRAFLQQLFLSKEPFDKEICRLIVIYTRADWQASVGLLIGRGEKPEKPRQDWFLTLIRRGKKQRVITMLRKQIARRRKHQKLAAQRLRRKIFETYRTQGDTYLLDRE